MQKNCGNKLCEKLPLQNVENNKQSKISIFTFLEENWDKRDKKNCSLTYAMMLKGCVSEENNVALKSGISYIFSPSDAWFLHYFEKIFLLFKNRF